MPTFDLRKFGTFAPNVVGMFGTEVHLPDGTTIRAVFTETPAPVVDEYSNSSYQEYVLNVPPNGLGTLAAEQIVSIEDAGSDELSAYYVANVAPGKNGWWIVTLQDHS